MEAIKELQDIENSLFRAVDFIEQFLPDENDTTKLVKLTQPQKDAIDSIQYGFPLSHFDFREIDEPPRGVVMIWPRQTGKTSGCGYAADALLFLKPGCKIGIIAATEKQSRKLFNKIKKVLKNSIFWDYVIKKTLRVDFLETIQGSFVECWPCTDGIEGSTYDFLFIDEAALMDENIIFQSAMPTVTHGTRWIMLSTPKGPKGKFIEYYDKGLATRPVICNHCNEHFPQAAFNVERFPHGKIPIDEMHNCPFCGKKDYRYGVGQFSVPYVDPWNDGLRKPKYVKQLLDEAGWSPTARQEYLGEIISDASMVFLSEWLKNCTNTQLKNLFRASNKINYVLGIDYGRKHDASCFYVTHRDERTGKIILDYGLTVAGEFDEHKTYKYIREKLMKVIQVFNPVWVVPDATGMGDPLVEMLEEDITRIRRNGMPVKTQIFDNRNNQKGYIISRTSKPELVGNLISLFQRGMIRIPPTAEVEMGYLREELLRFECEDIAGSDYIKFGTQTFHDDRVIALALSCWGHRRRPTMVDKIKIRGVKYKPLEENYEGGSLFT